MTRSFTLPTVTKVVSRQPTPTETWGTIRSSAGTNVSGGTVYEVSLTYATGADGKWSGLSRNILVLSTPTHISSDIDISAARIKFRYRNLYHDAGDNPSVNIYLATPSDIENIVAADYSNLGSTAISTPIDWDDLDADWSTFELDASGIAIIPNTDSTKFCYGVRIANYDVAGTTPPSDGSINLTNFLIAGDSQGDIVLEYDYESSPIALTTPAYPINITSATFNGLLYDWGGLETTVSFEWGLTNSYGEGTDEQVFSEVTTFEYEQGGLAGNTTYHFRAIATNSMGTYYGEDVEFTTSTQSFIPKIIFI
jgi:hypothetical protein